MTYHSDVIGKRFLYSLYRPSMVRMLKSMDMVVATSPNYLENSPVLKKYVAPDRLKVIPLGIVEDSYKDAIKDAENIDINEKFGLETNQYFLFIGVLRKYKGLHYLIEGAKSSNLPVVMAGASSQLELFVQQSKNVDKARFLGKVTDSQKMALIKECRAAILPSHLRSEAFGVFLIEAAMCGKPLISCEIGTGTSYVNLNGETGNVILPQDPSAISEILKKFEESEELAHKLGLKARDRYERLFSGQALGRSYSELYQNVEAKYS